MNKYISRFLNDEKNYISLSEEKINKGKVFSENFDQKLSKKILLSSDIEIDSYKYLIKSNGWIYGDLNISKLPEEKITILLDNKKLKFSTANFNYLVDSDTGKFINFIESYFDDFFEKIDELDLPEGTITKLMCSKVLKSEDKQNIIDYIHKESKYDLFDDERELVRAIIDVYLQESITLKYETLEKLFMYEQERVKKIELLIQSASNLDEEQLYTLLRTLGDPYSSIKPKGIFAYLYKSDLNFRLASALEQSGYILNQNPKIRKIQLTLKRS